ncbi:MAG: hypothetical protein IPL63_10905 [Saprospiraceae bacterium]|nr:hypothetical protein [Saprospiraceae bacterium]
MTSKFKNIYYLKLICFYFFLGLLSCSKVVKNKGILGNNDDISLFLSGNGTKTIDNKIYNLQGKALQVSGTLSFKNGGKIINGTLIGKSVKIITSGNTPIFENISVKGKWDVPEGYLYWFSDGSDPVQNFKALCSLVEMESVCILDKMYAISTTTANEYYRTTKSVRISGVKRKECGLVLKTKHSHSNAYFRSVSGNNIYLKNMTLITEDYRNKIAPKGYDYYFAWSYYSSVDRESKPDLQYIKIDSCDILGAVSFRYSSSAQNTTPSEMLQTGIDTILVLNSKIEDCVSLIELSNGRYDISKIENNEIKNIYGPVFYYPLGDLTGPFSPTELSKLRKSFVFRNNRVYGEKPVFSKGEGYMSSFVVKGAEILVENNVFENIINENDEIETVPFYASALIQTKIAGNRVINCLGRGYSPMVGGSNCFLRIRGSRNVFVDNNYFELNSKALAALNVIKNENSDLSTANIAKFRFGLWTSNLNDEDFTAKYEFTDNIFNVAVLADHSIMSRSHILFKNNKIIIQYLAKYDSKNWGIGGDSHDGSMIVLRDKTKAGNLVFENNKIEIKKSASSRFLFTKDVNDNKEFSNVTYKNNIFQFDGEVSLAMPRSKEMFASNQLIGTGNISYNESTTNSPEITIQKMNVIQKITNYKAGENSPIHIKVSGIAKIVSENNQDSVINLMNIRFQDLYTNHSLKSSPVILNFTGNYIQKNGTKIKEEFQVLVKDFSTLYYMGLKINQNAQVLLDPEK